MTVVDSLWTPRTCHQWQRSSSDTGIPVGNTLSPLFAIVSPLSPIPHAVGNRSPPRRPGYCRLLSLTPGGRYQNARRIAGRNNEGTTVEEP